MSELASESRKYCASANADSERQRGWPYGELATTIGVCASGDMQTEPARWPYERACERMR